MPKMSYDLSLLRELEMSENELTKTMAKTQWFKKNMPKLMLAFTLLNTSNIKQNNLKEMIIKILTNNVYKEITTAT